MTQNTQYTDFLTLRTTNINVRISPLLKAKMIEDGAKMGINLTDYVTYALTKFIDTKPEPQILEADYLKLCDDMVEQANSYEQQLRDRKEEFRRLFVEMMSFERAVKPLYILVGKELQIGGKTYYFDKVTDVLDFVVKSFRIPIQ